MAALEGTHTPGGGKAAPWGDTKDSCHWLQATAIKNTCEPTVEVTHHTTLHSVTLKKGRRREKRNKNTGETRQLSKWHIHPYTQRFSWEIRHLQPAMHHSPTWPAGTTLELGFRASPSPPSGQGQLCCHCSVQAEAPDGQKQMWQRPGHSRPRSAQLSLSIASDSLRPHGPQHARPPCPSPTPSLLKLMSIDSAMPSNHLVLCHPLLLLPSIFPTIRVFSEESVLLNR